MTKRKIEDLSKTKHFCIAPWVHLHVIPNGNMQPCCIWDYGVYKEDMDRFGNINNTDSIEETLNHKNFKALRQKFLENQHERGCTRCYDRENLATNDTSMRQWMNETFGDQKLIDNTDEEGGITDVNLKYLDIRFSNICNLKCRMCGHTLSSTWYDEEKEIAEVKGFPAPAQKFINVDCYDKVEPYLEHVEEIYFAGGEPLLYPEHLKMLNKLIELGKTEVKIKYNSNLTSLKYKGVNFVDMWNKFKYVQIGASIDGIEDTVEYIRTGMSWEKFKNNYNTIKTEAPHVLITPSPTVGVLNLERFDEFEQFAIQEGWYDSVPFGINYIMQPHWQDIVNMPGWYKDRMITKLLKHVKWCDDHNVGGYTREKIYALTSRLQTYVDDDVVKDNMHKLEFNLNLWNKTGKLDWRASLPHIAALIDEYKERGVE